MSELKATPGPWVVETPLDFELSIVQANLMPFDWRFIASCSLPVESTDIQSSEVHANAQLIAAAPELADYVRDKADRGCEEASRLWRKCCGDD